MIRENEKLGRFRFQIIITIIMPIAIGKLLNCEFKIAMIAEIMLTEEIAESEEYDEQYADLADNPKIPCKSH